MLRPFTPEALELPADELWVEVEVELEVLVSTRGAPCVEVESDAVLLELELLLELLELLELELSELLELELELSELELLELEVVVELEVVEVVPPLPVEPPPLIGAGQSIQKVLDFLEFWAQSISKW